MINRFWYYSCNYRFSLIMFSNVAIYKEPTRFSNNILDKDKETKQQKTVTSQNKEGILPSSFCGDF